jgi:pteridine reductase
MSEAGSSPVALVTGGARRIGAAIVRCLHRNGVRVAVHYHGSAEEAEALVQSLNAERAQSARAFRLDLSDLSRHGDLIASCTDHFGRLDYLVNNASSFYPTRLPGVTESDWEDLIGINLKAPFFLAQTASPQLKAATGAIVNIVDIYGSRPLAGYAVYSTAKAGLIMLTRALAVELAPEVRVNAVAPGAILWPERRGGDGERDAVVARTALKRTGDPEDVARAVLFLARDAAYTTGEILSVDGGRSLRY